MTPVADVVGATCLNCREVSRRPRDEIRATRGRQGTRRPVDSVRGQAIPPVGALDIRSILRRRAVEPRTFSLCGASEGRRLAILLTLVRSSRRSPPCGRPGSDGRLADPRRRLGQPVHGAPHPRCPWHEGDVLRQHEHDGDGGFLSWQQLAALNGDGHEGGRPRAGSRQPRRRGCHGGSRQICDDRANLLGRGFVVTSFAYPFGAYDDTVKAIVRDCGYASGPGRVRARNITAPNDSRPYARSIHLRILDAPC